MCSLISNCLRNLRNFPETRVTSANMPRIWVLAIFIISNSSTLLASYVHLNYEVNVRFHTSFEVCLFPF